jgi:TRAP-type C4-dicarboxylate transport system substrate-binding protein
LHRPADTDTYRQPEETPRSTELTLPIEPYDPQFQAASAASTTLVSHACDSVGSAPPADLYQQQYQTSSTTVIKIATAAPEGSGWMKAMRASAKEIQDRTDGRVQIKYYGGGVMGNDTKVLGKIRIGNLQGGAFTPSTFQVIYPDLNIYGLPLLFESDDEANYVRRQLDGRLLQGLREAGFVSFGFSATGFVYIMSNEPVDELGDLHGKRAWVPENDTMSSAAMKALGAVPIPLPLTDVYTALQTGSLDIVSVSPLAAAILQYHTKLKYITDVPLVYTMGLMAIDKKTFDKINAPDQSIVTEVMARVYCHFDKSNLVDNKEAYEALLRSGIQSVAVSVDEMQKIRAIIEASNRQLAEQGFFSKTLYEDLLDHIEDYRSQSR